MSVYSLMAAGTLGWFFPKPAAALALAPLIFGLLLVSADPNNTHLLNWFNQMAAGQIGDTLASHSFTMLFAAIAGSFHHDN